jgi:hypothetical protein
MADELILNPGSIAMCFKAKDGKFYAKGIKYEDALDKGLYMLLVSLCRTLKNKGELNIHCHMRNEVDGSTRGISFCDKKDTAEDLYNEEMEKVKNVTNE